MRTDKEIAKVICRAVLEAYEKEEKIFGWDKIKIKMTPENQLISIMPRKLQPLWLFFSLPADRMVDSTEMYRQFRDFYLKNPNFLDIKNIRKYCKKGEIPDVDVQLIFNKPEFLKFTQNNLEKLLSEFKGDPLRIFSNGYFQDNIKELKKFLGYGTGISSLYLIFLQRYGLKETKGLVPKIDRHIISISNGCGVVDIEPGMRSGDVCKKLFNVYQEVISENKFDAVILDPALWIIGHEICTKGKKVDCNYLCPLDEYCSKDRVKIGLRDILKKGVIDDNQLYFDF